MKYSVAHSGLRAAQPGVVPGAERRGTHPAMPSARRGAASRFQLLDCGVKLDPASDFFGGFGGLRGCLAWTSLGIILFLRSLHSKFNLCTCVTLDARGHLAWTSFGIISFRASAVAGGPL